MCSASNSDVSPAAAAPRNARVTAAKSGVSAMRGDTAWVNVVRPIRSPDFSPAISASLAVVRSARRRPDVLPLRSKARTTLIGAAAVSTSDTVCGTPLSSTTKSSARSPGTGRRPSITCASTLTARIPEENVGLCGAADSVASARSATATPKPAAFTGRG